MGIFFAILSPALYSVVNYVDKFLLEKYNIHPTVIAVYSGLVAFVFSIILVLFTGLHVFDLRTTFFLFLSGVLTILTLVPYFKALSLDEASRVIPLFQIVPIFVLIFSFFFLNERFALHQYAGAGLIIISAFLLSIERLEKGVIKLRKALWYMTVASLMSALSFILFKVGVSDINFWHSLPYEGFGIVFGSLCILLYKNNKKEFTLQTKKLPKKIFPYMFLNELIFVASRYSAFFALSLVSASIVSVLSGFQPLFILVFGIILSLRFPHLIKEVLNKETLAIKFIAGVGIFLGIFLLSM